MVPSAPTMSPTCAESITADDGSVAAGGVYRPRGPDENPDENNDMVLPFDSCGSPEVRSGRGFTSMSRINSTSACGTWVTWATVSGSRPLRSIAAGSRRCLLGHGRGVDTRAVAEVGCKYLRHSGTHATIHACNETLRRNSCHERTPRRRRDGRSRCDPSSYEVFSVFQAANDRTGLWPRRNNAEPGYG